MLEAAGAHALVGAATLATVVLCVLLQYEYLLLVCRWLAQHAGHRRVKVLYGVGSIIVLHLIEMCIFGIVLWLLLLWPECGTLAGDEGLGFFDHLYFSGITFTTVGFGEIWPLGPVRYFAGIEALVGLVLITWSASFTYLEMEKFWRDDDTDNPR